MALEDDKTADAPPSDDLKSVLAAAVAEHEAPAPDKPAKTPAKPAAADGGADDAAPKPAPKPLKAKPASAKDAGDADPEAEPDAAAKPGDQDPDKPDADADKTDDEKAEATAKAEADKAEAALTAKWSAKDKETLKALPPEGRDLILRRHKEMEVAFVKKTQEIATFRKDYEPVSKLLEPWTDRMKTAGYTPSSLITAWANVERRLMEGDGVGVVAGLIKGYKLDMGKVAQALGLRPLAQAGAVKDGEQPAAVEGQPHAQLPPEITQTLQSLQQRLDAQDRERADAQRRTVAAAEQGVITQIDKFKSAQDDKGQLLHPHFDEIEADMTSLAQAAIAARKPVPSLQELYENAVWANPSTRAAKLAADKKAQQQKAADEARTKAEKARKAGSSVTGAPGSGQAPAGGKSRADLSLREQLETAAAEASEA